MKKILLLLLLLPLIAFAAKGDLLIERGNGTFQQGTLTVGTNGQCLIANSSATDGINWGTLEVVGGGTGNTSFIQYPIVGAGGTGALVASSSPTVISIFATSTTATSTFEGGGIFGRGFQLKNYTSCNLDTDANGFIQCGVDATGGAITPWTSDIQGADFSLFNISNLTATGSLKTTGGFFATGTSMFTGLISTASSTLLNITNLSGTNATATTLYVNGVASLNGASTTITNLITVGATSTNGYYSGLLLIASTSPSVSASLSSKLTIGGGISASATSTLAGLVVNAGGIRTNLLICNGYSNDGAITTDADGNFICSDDASGSGSQTPWLADINANGYDLSGLNTVSATATLRVSLAAFPGQLLISTTTASAGQWPMLLVTSTTTGMGNYSRVAVGTTTIQGNNTMGLRDQFTVAGRINSTSEYLGCDFPSANVAIGPLQINTGVCGLTFMEHQEGQLFPGTTSPGSYITLAASSPASLAVGEGAMFGFSSSSLAATTTPVMEALVRINSTSYSQYIVGFVAATSSTHDMTLGIDGYYFTANPYLNSGRWTAVNRFTTGAGAKSTTTIDTGVSATSTAAVTAPFQALRIEASTSTIYYLIDGKIVAQLSTTTSMQFMSPQVNVFSLDNTGGTREIQLKRMRIWNNGF